MPVHFAAARSTAHSPIARALARKAHSRAANDNAGAAQMVATASSIDGVMHAALKHFANHGLSAAKVAAQRLNTPMRPTTPKVTTGGSASAERSIVGWPDALMSSLPSNRCWRAYPPYNSGKSTCYC